MYATVTNWSGIILAMIAILGIVCTFIYLAKVEDNVIPDEYEEDITIYGYVPTYVQHVNAEDVWPHVVAETMPYDYKKENN